MLFVDGLQTMAIAMRVANKERVECCSCFDAQASSSLNLHRIDSLNKELHLCYTQLMVALWVSHHHHHPPSELSFSDVFAITLLMSIRDPLHPNRIVVYLKMWSAT